MTTATSTRYKALVIAYKSGSRYLMSPLHSADVLLLVEGGRIYPSHIPSHVKSALKESRQGSKGAVLLKYVKELLGEDRVETIVSVNELEVDGTGIWGENDVATRFSDAMDVARRYQT